MSEGGFPRTTLYIVVAVVLVAVAAFILFRPGDGVPEDTVDPTAIAGEDVSVVLGEEVRLDAGDICRSPIEIIEKYRVPLHRA